MPVNHQAKQGARGSKDSKAGLGFQPRSLDQIKIADPKIRRVQDSLKQRARPVEGEGWLSMGTCPAGQNMTLQALPDPLPNHLLATFEDQKEYLEVLWRIIRYEGIQPLWAAVNEFKKAPSMKETNETCIYEKAYCVGFNVIRLGTFARIKFSALRSERTIAWGQTQRLTPGSIVALSTAKDGFRTKCAVGLVAGKEDKDLQGAAMPTIDLEFEGNGFLAVLLEPEEELVMIEARSNYFEAVRHAMAGLKQATAEVSPLMKYFTGERHDVCLPEGIANEDDRIDVSALNENGETTTIPARGPIPQETAEICQLDPSQMTALQKMLATDLAIVQGPPGTGKTHSSMAALKVLLMNQKPTDAPIIVAAQKNETVDDIMSRLMKQGVKIARLGGQSQDETVIRCTLPKLRSRFIRPTRKVQTEQSLDHQREKLKTLINKCLPYKDKLLLDPEDLHEVGVLTFEQCASMVKKQVVDDPVSARPGRGVRKSPFAAWLDHKFSQRQQPIAKQTPWGLGIEVTALRRGYLAEEDPSQTKKDRISNQVVNFGQWCQLEETSFSHEQMQDARRALASTADLWTIPPAKRPALYAAMRERMLQATRELVKPVLRTLAALLPELKSERSIEDFAAIRASGARVIGCTTTGLTKYRGLLAAIDAKTMIIEEAAETREANIAAALFPSLQRLILVGDHLQLSPHADVLKLAQPPYNLNVSLFEKLVTRGLDYATLSDQRRMAPEIRRVLNTWYPSLRDHPKVTEMPEVPGMGATRALWLQHRHPESDNRYSSKYSSFEARVITGLAHFLVLNGTHPSKITVLSFYAGQKTYIYNMMQRIPELATKFDKTKGILLRKGVEIQTVDGFQGKENDIILLSVVRSPRSSDGSNVGFLSKLNRAIVSLSRAKHLNVVCGNLTHLTTAPASTQVWAPVGHAMTVMRDASVPLVCLQHGRSFRVGSQQQAWIAPARIGCGHGCGKVLECQHTCVLRCHPTKVSHACACTGLSSAHPRNHVYMVCEDLSLDMHMDDVIDAESPGGLQQEYHYTMETPSNVPTKGAAQNQSDRVPKTYTLGTGLTRPCRGATRAEAEVLDDTDLLVRW